MEALSVCQFSEEPVLSDITGSGNLFHLNLMTEREHDRAGSFLEVINNKNVDNGFFLVYGSNYAHSFVGFEDELDVCDILG